MERKGGKMWGGREAGEKERGNKECIVFGWNLEFPSIGAPVGRPVS